MSKPGEQPAAEFGASESASLGERVVARCLELGFAAAGIAPAEPSSRAEEYRAWIAAGKHGEMEYLSSQAEKRLDISAFEPGAKSIVVVAELYRARERAGLDRSLARHPVGETSDERTRIDGVPIGGPTRPHPDGDESNRSVRAGTEEFAGTVARYARGKDYHDVMKRRLRVLCHELRAAFPGERFRVFTDDLPVLEREHAVRAGLGWIGKHSLVIHPRLGSWVFLGGIVSTLRIEPPTEQRSLADACGTCTRCIDACPTEAITPYSVDASRCVSYLTIEHRSGIAEELSSGVGEWIFGCDVCQEVCPHNSPRADGVGVGTAHAAYEARIASLPILDVLGWDDATRRRVLSGSAMKRGLVEMWKRNAIVAGVNRVRAGVGGESTREAFAARLREIAGDPGEAAAVRETAAWAVARLAREEGVHGREHAERREIREAERQTDGA
jgi:epoxyqueuosine reductase